MNNKFVIEHNFKDTELMKLLQNQIVDEQRLLIRDNLSHNMPEFYKRVLKPMENYFATSRQIENKDGLEIIESLVLCKRCIEQVKALRYHRRRSLLNSGRRLLRIKNLLKESMSNIKLRKQKSLF